MEEPDLLEMLRVSRAAKEQTDIFIPIIFWKQPADNPVIALIPPAIGVFVDDLSLALQEMKDEFGRPSWFAVVSDAYATQARTPEQAMAAEPGDLAVAFKQGDPDVIEQLVLACATCEGLVLMRQQYRHHPIDGWEWDDPAPFQTAFDTIRIAMSIVELS